MASIFHSDEPPRDEGNAGVEGGRTKPVHVPVLLREVLDLLAPKPGGRYLDGTLGLGGHARAILERCGDCELLGLDRDPEAIRLAGEGLAGFKGRIHIRRLPFSRFEEALEDVGWEHLDGALVDLGVSSMQLDQADRGFSFLRDGPLDMRMDPASGAAPASTFVNTASFRDLASAIGTLGEDPQAGRIARAIIREREENGPFETTARLASVVEQAYPAKWRRTARNHPATRTFQGLRMAVNNELGELDEFLRGIVDRLKPGGRVAVISFHSLEDRAVKRFFREQAKSCVCPPEQVICTCAGVPRLDVLTKKPVGPGDEETRDNPRSRSAKLRVAERHDPAAGDKAGWKKKRPGKKGRAGR